MNYFQAIQSFFSGFLFSMPVIFLSGPHASTNLGFADQLPKH
jgi:hypothetical protein